MNETETRASSLLPIRVDLARIIEALGEGSHLHGRLPQKRVDIAKEHLKLAVKEIDAVLDSESGNRG